MTLTANDKTCDGTTGATGALSLAGLVAGDQVGVTGSIACDSRTYDGTVAATGRITLNGVLAGNLVSTAAAYAFADANAASTYLYATFSRSVTLLWTACFSQWYSPRRAI